jgi:hypothetical protein
MARFIADSFSGVSVEGNETTFTLTNQNDEVMNLSVPESLLPQLFMFLSQCWKQIVAAREGQPVVAYTQTLDRTQVLPLESGDVVMILNLPDGMDVPFALPPEAARLLAQQLTDTLENNGE